MVLVITIENILLVALNKYLFFRDVTNGRAGCAKMPGPAKNA